MVDKVDLNKQEKGEEGAATQDWVSQTGKSFETEKQVFAGDLLICPDLASQINFEDTNGL